VHTATLRFPDSRERVFQHRGTRADCGVFAQIFESQDYSLERLRRGAELRSRYDAMVGAGRRPLILDAGANIGASVVYFAMTFPRAHVLALEPERNNFDLLRENTAGLDVELLCAGIGAVPGESALVDPGEGEWGYRTIRGGAGAPVAIRAASDLVEAKRAQGFEPFIAKIDIEGGEAELFSRDTEWVGAFALLIVELHDWLLPGSASSRNFLRCVAALDRDFVYLGENVFSIRNDWTAAPVRA